MHVHLLNNNILLERWDQIQTKYKWLDLMYENDWLTVESWLCRVKNQSDFYYILELTPFQKSSIFFSKEQKKKSGKFNLRNNNAEKS